MLTQLYRGNCLVSKSKATSTPCLAAISIAQSHQHPGRRPNRKAAT